MYSFNLLYSFKQNSENRLASQDDWSCTAWWADLLGTKRIWKGGNPKIIQGKICGVFWPSFLAEWSFQFNVFTRLPHFKSRWLPSWPLFSLTFCQAQFQLASIAKLSWVSTRVSCFSKKLSKLSGNEICQYFIYNSKISWFIEFSY